MDAKLFMKLKTKQNKFTIWSEREKIMKKRKKNKGKQIKLGE